MLSINNKISSSHPSKFYNVEFLGKGGQGSVFLLNEHQVIKLFQDYNEFNREYKLLDKLFKIDESGHCSKFLQNLPCYFDSGVLEKVSNINFIKKYKFDPSSDIYYIISEYVQGVNLEKMKKGNKSRDFFLKAIHDMLVALTILQYNNIIHNDVRLANIVYQEKENIFVLLDLGMACGKYYECINLVTDREKIQDVVDLYSSFSSFLPDEFFDYTVREIGVAKDELELFETRFQITYFPEYHVLMEFLSKHY